MTLRGIVVHTLMIALALFQWPHTQTLMRESRDRRTFEDITYNTCPQTSLYESNELGTSM